MIVTDGPAPYAPAHTVMSVINRHRQVALPQFDLATMQRISVTDSLAPRVLQTLRLLDLIDEDGKPTPAFEDLRKAATSDFQPMLADLLRQAYAPIFAVVDPTKASAAQIEDAFRHFTPAGQRGRMVTLFSGLMAEAGLVAEAPKKKRGPRTSTPNPSTRSQTSPKPERTSVPEPPTPARNGGPQHPSAAGDTYSVELASGGTVTVGVNVNLFKLSPPDREYVIDLVDRLTGYQPDTKVDGGDVVT